VFLSRLFYGRTQQSKIIEFFQAVMEFCVGAFQRDEYEFGQLALYLNNFDIEYYLLDSDDVYTSRTSPAFQKHF
jgi:hypothetical protein